jgi:hypothetical protein
LIIMRDRERQLWTDWVREREQRKSVKKTKRAQPKEQPSPAAPDGPGRPHEDQRAVRC